MKKITLILFALIAIPAFAQQTFYYEDFLNATDRGFEGKVVNLGGAPDAANILKRISDVPDAADTTPSTSPTHPTNRIPAGTVADQRALSTAGNNTTTNFSIDAYAVFTTLDMTTANSKIPAGNTYKYASFWTQRRYGDGDIATITMVVSTDYAGNPATATWTNLPMVSGKIATTSDGLKYVKGIVDLSAYANGANGNKVTLALRYQGSSTAWSATNRNGTLYFSDLQFYSQSTATLSVENVVLKQGISVYPNPANNILNINKTDSTIEIKNVNLFDSVGKIIYNAKDTQSIDLSNFTKGIYFLRIESASGGSFTQKIIKN
jgi:hypothetical protein